nr:MAG TPA_asm: hypothetical protein [Bacteriophage sp.]
MTNRDRLIEALRGTLPDAEYKMVMQNYFKCPYIRETEVLMDYYKTHPYKKGDKLPKYGLCNNGGGGLYPELEEMCIKCREDWLSQELDCELDEAEKEMEGITNANI